MIRPAFLLLLASGCAATLSGFQPAHVPEKGHVGVEIGWDVSAPTGTITRAVDGGETLAKAANHRTLSDGERQQVIEAGANLAMNPPALVMHAGIAYVPVQDWEVSLRWSSGAWRAGLRHQFLSEDRHGVDLTAGLGVARFAYEFPIGDVVDVLKLDDFTRWSLEVPLLVGKRASWYRLWAGPRIVLSRYNAAMTLKLPATSVSSAETLTASAGGSAAFLGGQVGIALGYRYLFIGLELTTVRLISTARLDLAGHSQDADLGGWIIYPGIALMGEF